MWILNKISLPLFTTAGRGVVGMGEGDDDDSGQLGESALVEEVSVRMTDCFDWDGEKVPKGGSVLRCK